LTSHGPSLSLSLSSPRPSPRPPPTSSLSLPLRGSASSSSACGTLRSREPPTRGSAAAEGLRVVGCSRVAAVLLRVWSPLLCESRAKAAWTGFFMDETRGRHASTGLLADQHTPGTISKQRMSTNTADLHASAGAFWKDTEHGLCCTVLYCCRYCSASCRHTSSLLGSITVRLGLACLVSSPPGLALLHRGRWLSAAASLCAVSDSDSGSLVLAHVVYRHAAVTRRHLPLLRRSRRLGLLRRSPKQPPLLPAPPLLGLDLGVLQSCPSPPPTAP
jgi:hypothetical protein